MQTIAKRRLSPVLFYDLLSDEEAGRPARYGVKVYFQGEADSPDPCRCSTLAALTDSFAQAEAFVAGLAAQVILPAHLRCAAEDFFGTAV